MLRADGAANPSFKENYQSQSSAGRRKRKAREPGRSRQTLTSAEPCRLPASDNQGVCVKQEQVLAAEPRHPGLRYL